MYLIQSSDIGICKTLRSSKAHDKNVYDGFIWD